LIVELDAVWGVELLSLLFDNPIANPMMDSL
jgi:hypothetical protein